MLKLKIEVPEEYRNQVEWWVWNTVTNYTYVTTDETFTRILVLEAETIGDAYLTFRGFGNVKITTIIYSWREKLQRRIYATEKLN